jgi:hypothetical protein
LDNINIYWKYLINYEAFRNQKILLRSDKGLDFSNYIKSVIGAKSSYRRVVKGYLEKDGWTIVVNSSVNHTTGERIRLDNLENIINLNQDYLSEDLSALFYASDAVLIPYKKTSGSGVMFDAWDTEFHSIASDLSFFREFASKGLGITAKRTPNAFSDAFLKLEFLVCLSPSRFTWLSAT